MIVLASEPLRLESGARIAVIGAGPAGCLFALRAFRLARLRGLRISVTMFDGKDFLRRGPPGCNMCAGIVAETLVERLAAEGLAIPEDRVQGRIDAYLWRTEHHSLLVRHPSGKRTIFTVFRGNGPRFCEDESVVSFDDFLLQQARSAGATIISEPVRDLILPEDPVHPVGVLYGRGNEPRVFSADLVVGAFGVDGAIVRRLEEAGFGFRAPRSVRSSQAELPLSDGASSLPFPHIIGIFTLKKGRFALAALIPKRGYLTVSLVGDRDMGREDLVEFLERPQVKEWLPDNFTLPEQFCMCLPKIPVSPARHPFRDRLVIIGDASYCRYYKNGLESAFLTACLAADCALNHGVSSQAFARHYDRRARRLIVRDNFYARLIFRLYIWISRMDWLTRAYIAVAPSDSRNRGGDLLRSFLWNLFTGNLAYGLIFRRCFNPRLWLELAREVTRGLLKRGVPSPDEIPPEPEPLGSDL